MGRIRLAQGPRPAPRRHVRGLHVAAPRTAGARRRYFDLRWRLLRAPWGRPRGSERDASDAHAVHLMAYAYRTVPVGVGRLHFNTPHEAQIRYMAVDKQWHGRGVGRRLLAALESRARARGARRIVLDARAGACGFYARHGYRCTRRAHTLFGTVAHWRMVKDL